MENLDLKSHPLPSPSLERLSAALHRVEKIVLERPSEEQNLRRQRDIFKKAVEETLSDLSLLLGKNR